MTYLVSCGTWNLTHSKLTEGKGKVRFTYIAPQAAYDASIDLCVTDRACVYYRPQPSPRSRTLACSHIAARSLSLPFTWSPPPLTMQIPIYRPRRDGRLSWLSWLTHMWRCLRLCTCVSMCAGSPFHISVIDPSKAVARGDGLDLVQCNQTASFFISAPACQLKDFDLKIIGISNLLNNDDVYV